MYGILVYYEFKKLTMTKVILVHLGLGSNLGNRLDFLNQACRKLESMPLLKFHSSKIYESEPLLKMQQPNYLNIVVCGFTELTPFELLKKCQEIENRLGRVRKDRWGSRNIDIDILSFGDEIIDTDALKIPHPEMVKRSFVLRPLLELMDSQPAAVVPMVQSHQGGVLIGSEHPHEALVKCAVVHASYKSSNEGIGHVSLVGPMRMAYATAMATVRSVANHLNRVLC